jgi:pyruvate/2-oxoglutarate dehydrogenase complex dihydrolipoamide acyltransferase (E2) component
VYVIDRFDFDAPKTSRIAELVGKLGVADQKVLILTDGAKPNVFLSGRNLPTVHVMPYSDVSTYHILWSDVVLIESSAIGQSMEPLNEARSEKPSARKTAAKAAAPAKKAAAKKAAKAPAKKAAAKKAAKPAAKKAAKPAAKKAAKKKGK